MHIAPVAPGIVDKPAQREVGADSIEQGKRKRIALFALPQAVCDFVAHGGKPWRWKVARKLACRDISTRDLLRTLNHVGIGDLLSADPNLDFDAVFRYKRVKLLKKIAAEGARVRDRCLINAWARHFGEGAARG